MARVLILDSEAVSALAEQRNGMAERLAAAQQADHRVLIPAVVLAEVATGAASDAAIWHVLGKVPTLDLPQGVAMRAGALRTRAERVRRKKRDLTVDAWCSGDGIGLCGRGRVVCALDNITITCSTRTTFTIISIFFTTLLLLLIKRRRC